MELSLITPTTRDLTTNSELSFEICDEAKHLGLVVRYDTIEYRGEEVNFLSSVDGVQCFAQWRGTLIDLGLNNIYYKEDMCKFIDRQLDLITDYRDCPNFVGAKLEYFHNGDYRDIRLVYKGRVLKIFLVTGSVNETWVISESERILRSSGLLDEI
jgi:hypothetical protein